jgi:hypothetical protein
VAEPKLGCRLKARPHKPDVGPGFSACSRALPGVWSFYILSGTAPQKLSRNTLATNAHEYTRMNTIVLIRVYLRSSATTWIHSCLFVSIRGLKCFFTAFDVRGSLSRCIDASLQTETAPRPSGSGSTYVHKSGSAWRCPTLLMNRCMWRRAMPCDPPGFARRGAGPCPAAIRPRPTSSSSPRRSPRAARESAWDIADPAFQSNRPESRKPATAPPICDRRE